VRRGELWWGSPGLAGGSTKRRPFLVVSADFFNANPRYPKVMAVQLTTAVRARSFDWEVEVPRGVAGLESASVVKCGEVYTLLKRQLVEAIGTFPLPWQRRVDEALAVALSLPVAQNSAPADR
jgi:mRNA-degrading endonuclease toxin of MazEF toxin-antitoxin module